MPDTTKKKAPKKRKALTHRCFVRIGDGPYVNWKDLSREEQIRLAEKMNDTMLRAAGFRPVAEIEEEKRKRALEKSRGTV